MRPHGRKRLYGSMRDLRLLAARVMASSKNQRNKQWRKRARNNNNNGANRRRKGRGVLFLFHYFMGEGGLCPVLILVYPPPHSSTCSFPILAVVGSGCVGVREDAAPYAYTCFECLPDTVALRTFSAASCTHARSRSLPPSLSISLSLSLSLSLSPLSLSPFPFLALTCFCLFVLFCFVFLFSFFFLPCRRKQALSGQTVRGRPMPSPLSTLCPICSPRASLARPTTTTRRISCCCRHTMRWSTTRMPSRHACGPSAPALIDQGKIDIKPVRRLFHFLHRLSISCRTNAFSAANSVEEITKQQQSLRRTLDRMLADSAGEFGHLLANVVFCLVFGGVSTSAPSVEPGIFPQTQLCLFVCFFVFFCSPSLTRART